MITMDLDKESGWIKITASGSVTREEVGENLQAFLKMSSEFEGEFAIINDLSHFDPGPEALLTLGKIHLKLAEMGKISRVVRVVGKSKPLLVKLSSLDKQNNIRGVQYVPTVEAAEALIQKSGSP